MEAPRIFLVPHTHWDREWYAPFDVFLRRLVRMMDGLIDLLTVDRRFAHFHLDGQTAMIDDYLAVRPEREGDIRRLAREGRLSIGPWFTQMDEFLVGGESLVRNLEWGLARGRELGASLRVGYLPDQFGHVGQMPQILRREGIEHAVVWRGVPGAVDRSAFWWESPDGSRVLAEYLAFGYGVGLRLAGCQDADCLGQGLRAALDLLGPISPRDRVLVTVGSDHQGPAAALPALLEEVVAADGLRAEIGSVAGYLDCAAPEGIPSWRGELRSAARAPLLPGVYSTRTHQKRERARVEALVERYAEPLAALVPGLEWPDEELREAWRLLLWNGAHDSVSGCSVDEVARAVDGRYQEAGIIARDVMHRSMEALAGRMRSAGTMFFNPSPFERDGVPGLGWRVNALPAVHPPAPLRVVDGAILAAGFRLHLVDEGDVGDLYNFCPTPEAPPRGPASMVVEGDEAVARWDGLEVRLRAEEVPGEPHLRVLGTVRNDRPDHRLRLHVALDAAPTGSWALAPFEVVNRPVVGEGGSEVPSPTWPARGGVVAGDLAVTQDGVFEYEVRDRPPEVVVTLLRSVGTISRGPMATRGRAAGPDIPTPNAQMIGEHPFAMTLWRGLPPERLPEAWERMHLPLYHVPANGGGDLPDSGSLLEVEGGVLSSVRRVGDGLEVRVWNPSQAPRRARIGGVDINLGPARIETVAALHVLDAWQRP